MTPCVACTRSHDVAAQPLAERVVVESGWRVAHAFGTSLPGWLVLLPLRHVTALHDLTEDEAAAMGRLLHRCSTALHEVTGCAKAYFAFFAEADGYEHLHVHVVPRMPWFGEEQRGPRAFSLLGVPADVALPDAKRDAVARDLQRALGHASDGA